MPTITSSIWTAEGLPEGVVIDKDTGVISGTAANAGDYKVPVSVTTDWGNDVKDVNIKVKSGMSIHTFTVQAQNTMGAAVKEFNIMVRE
ncbi:MAG: putative Ig domain-containing protein [Synergistaceae bacterium]|nr:putative Ig domain-containing protein [Synergistaceae bacterium]